MVERNYLTTEQWIKIAQEYNKKPAEQLTRELGLKSTRQLHSRVYRLRQAGVNIPYTKKTLKMAVEKLSTDPKI